ncbi:MAG: glycosyltransferase [Alicyclobacillus herbarius]|uniref:glycosyltransferase n=1 Tax=Alicyclobacillus herbarius TaxID=122960 RepID=UPI000405EC6A|nr:glycosyltransferase [Alicyclobacillus herbarius]MCL6632365.1 glycosyltransferase [Alicyclobacillus herbarius]
MIIDIVLGRAWGRGGLETVLSIVSQELQKRGHKVRLFQFEPPEHKAWLQTIPTMYYYDPVALHYRAAYDGEISIFRHALGYRQLLTEMGVPDVVLATHTPYFSLMCRLSLAYLESQQPPIVTWLHGPVDAFGGGELLKYADAHLAISAGVADSIRRALLQDAPLHVVGNPFDFSSISRVPRATKQLELLYIGRLHNQQKRLDVLFQALSQLRGHYRLTIIGDGPDRAALQNLADQLKINSRIHWAGWKEKPWDHVREASLLVLTSDYEGFGMVLVEALSRGIPVAASNCAGPSDIVMPTNGWLFEPGNAGELATILQDLIDGRQHLPTPEQCEQSVQAYRKEFVVDQIEAALHEARAFTQRKRISAVSLASN